MWLRDDSLGVDLGVGLFSLVLGLVVVPDPLQEVLPRGRFLDVFDSHVDPLGDDAVPDLLVDDDTEGPWVDVEDSTGLAMVVLVGHALVDGAVNGDVDDLATLVGSECLGDVDGACLSESLLELVTGSPSVAVCVCHFTTILIK